MDGSNPETADLSVVEDQQKTWEYWDEKVTAEIKSCIET